MTDNKTVQRTHDATPETGTEVLRWMQREFDFIEGASYGLSEEGGKQVRRRLSVVRRQVKGFLQARGHLEPKPDGEAEDE